MYKVNCASLEDLSYTSSKFSNNAKYAHCLGDSQSYDYNNRGMLPIVFNSLGQILLSFTSVIPYIRLKLVDRIPKSGFYLGLTRSTLYFKFIYNQIKDHGLLIDSFVYLYLICTTECQTPIFIKFLEIYKEWRMYQLLD